MTAVGGLGLGVAALFVTASISWIIVAAWLGAIFSLLWILNTVSRAGIIVTEHVLRVWVGHRTWAFPVDEIDHVRVSGRPGEDHFTVYFDDGEIFMLPPGALPASEEFALALTEQGIRVRRVA